MKRYGLELLPRYLFFSQASFTNIVLSKLKCKKCSFRATIKGQWSCQRLPSCGYGFQSQAHHLRFFRIIQLKLSLYLSFGQECEKNENKRKKAGIGPFQCDQMPKMFAQYLAIFSSINWPKSTLNFLKQVQKLAKY